MTFTGLGSLSYSATPSVPPNGPWAVIGAGNPIVPEFPAVWFGPEAFVSDTLTIVPAPSALAVLGLGGLGGLAVGRRRR